MRQAAIREMEGGRKRRLRKKEGERKRREGGRERDRGSEEGRSAGREGRSEEEQIQRAKERGAGTENGEGYRKGGERT